MAGTSGCIPSHNVNFFGCLCSPRRSPPSASPPSPSLDIENQAIEAAPSPSISPQPILPPPPSRTAVPPAPPDRLGELFAENQALIRTYSPANIHTFQATIQQTFSEVRRLRAPLSAAPPAESPFLRAARSPVGPTHGDEAGRPNSSHAIQGPTQQRPDRKATPPKPELRATQPRSTHHAVQSHRPHHHHPSNPPPRLLITPYSKPPPQNRSSDKSPLQGGEITLFGVELRVEDGEMEIDGAELLWLDALLMANYTGDPGRKFGFGR